MAQCPVFKSVRLPHNDRSTDGTTQLMNLRSENLFEIYNAAEIYDELLSNPTNSLSFNSSMVTVKSAILDDTCFICVDRTVHCFKIGSRADDSAVFELDAPPADICIVPGQKIILFLLQNGSICFFISELSKLTTTKRVFEANTTKYNVAFGGFGPFLSLSVLATFETHSEVRFVKFPPFEQLAHGSAAFFDATQLLKHVQNMNHCFVAGDKFGFAFFPKRKGSPILKQCAYTLHVEALSSAPLTPAYSLPCGTQSVHRIGKLVGVLTDGLECILFNGLEDLVSVGALQLGGFRGNIVDFAVLDFDTTVLNPSNRMIIHIEGVKNRIILTDVQSSRIAFEFECSENVCLNAATAQTELNNNVVIVESFSAKRPTSVQLRFIFEAQPEIRLRNLLDKGRFEEALDCARVYRLPLDQVYERQITALIETINADGSTSNDDLDKLLGLLNKLAQTQEENAIDYAFLAATSATDYFHIQKLLVFCSKCRPQDQVLSENLSRLKYALESYRLLFGDQASYARDSHWPNFCVGENHWALFEQMLEESKIDKCVELWSRYRNDLSELLVEMSAEFFPELLRHLERTIAGSAGEMCKEISKFLEKDLLPPFFTEDKKDYLDPFRAELVDFFRRVSLSLWQLDQQHFPDNAYEFSSTISRVVKKLPTVSREKKHIVQSLNKHGVGVIDFSSAYMELDRMVVKLKRLCYLHKTYNFTSSYEAFHDLTAEEIGNLLMDKIYTIPNNMVYVNETVFKYCGEVGLDCDTLLLNYIKKADLSKIVNVCIDMCKLFANDDFRAEAAMLIAPSRSLPWTPDMNQLFNNLSQLQTLPEMTQIQLKETKLRADISMIMRPFGGDVMLEIEDSNDLLNYCTALFAHTKVSIEERVGAAQKVCKLSMHNSKIAVTTAECFVRAIKSAYATSNSTEQLDQTLCLLDYIDDLDVREEVAGQCASSAYRMLSAKNILDESIPLCAYFLIQIAQHLPTELKNQYVKRATLICQIFELCNVVVFADRLGNVHECAQILISISAENEDASFLDIVDIGGLFLMSKEDVVIHLITHFVQNELVDRVENIFSLIPTLFDKLPHHELVEAVHYGMAYLFRHFSSYNWSFLDLDKLSTFIDNIRSISSLVLMHEDNSVYFTKFLPILEYVNFVEYALVCSKQIDASSSNTTMAAEIQPRVLQLSDKEEAFTDLERRLNLPMYGIENESSVLGSGSSILQGVCKVAESICQPMHYLKGWPSKSYSMANVYRTQWISLITMLGSQTSVLLAISAAQICFKLDLFVDHQQEILVLYDQAIIKLLERQLAIFNVDWIQIIEQLGFRGFKQSNLLVKTLRENRNLVKNRVLVVNSYLLKFIFSGTDRVENIQSSLEQFKRLSWQRELALCGINISSKIIEAPEKYIPQLVERLISPSVVVSLCRCYGKQLDSTLLMYAVNLCVAHSRRKIAVRLSSVLKCAQEALELIVNPPLETVRLLLLSVDQSFFPYDYEAIQIALNWCQKHCTDSQNSDWILQMQKLLAFLRVHKRRTNYTPNELEWFYGRINRVPTDNDTTINGTVKQPKTIDDVHDPRHLSLTRLPFQVFLATDDGGKAVARNVVTDQITTESLHEWALLSMELPRLLSYTRVFLESSSVGSDLRRCLERRMPCDEKLMLRVLSIINSNSNQISILRIVSSELSNVVQSEHKVKVFERLTALLEQRLKRPDQKPDSEKESEQAERMYKSLVNGRNAFFVLNLLAKYRLLNKRTSQLSGKVAELSKYIFERMTEWNDLDKIAAHVSFVRELDAQGLVKAGQIFEEMIADWLRKPKVDLNISDMALDETMEPDNYASTVQETIDDSDRDPMQVFLCKYLYARAVEGL